MPNERQRRNDRAPSVITAILETMACEIEKLPPGFMNRVAELEYKKPVIVQKML